MPKEAQDIVKGILEVANTKATMQEFLRAFETALKALSLLKAANQSEREQITASIEAFKAELDERFSGFLTKEKADMVAQMGRMLKQHEEKMLAVDQKLDTVENGKDADEEKIVAEVLAQIKLPEQKENIVDGPDEIRNKLELLQGDERLDKSAIKGLEELEAKVDKMPAPARIQTPAKSYQVRTKDASAQCDGNNKTFSVGGTHFGIIGVFCTSSPSIYRPIIDYTVTPTGILLTDAVIAPEGGQTMVIQFLK